ncbi:MAG: Mini-ribonuclease 3 [Clostridia bacterium]|nr:Mini-ribonuclease 3 [Clostridia bacterium]
MLEFEKIFGKLNENPKQVAPLVLAYIGDAVFELYIRGMLISRGERLSKNLSPKAIKYVKASAQKEYYELIIEELTDDEAIIARIAKNKKPSGVPKNSSNEEYTKATAFEAVIGYLYLKGDDKRLQYILKKCAGEKND